MTGRETCGDVSVFACASVREFHMRADLASALARNHCSYVLAERVEGFGSSASEYREWMKPKTMFYTALGFATYKVGKHMAKRKARQALAGQTPDKKT